MFADGYMMNYLLLWHVFQTKRQCKMTAERRIISTSILKPFSAYLS